MKKNYNNPTIKVSNFNAVNIMTTSDEAQPTLRERLNSAGVSSENIKEVTVTL